jgi:hypothetical protein
MKQFQEVKGTLFKDTDKYPKEIIWAIKKYIESNEMQSFVEHGSIFTINSIEEGNHHGPTNLNSDLYLVSYSLATGVALMGSRCVIKKSSIVDLVREYKLNHLEL